MYFVGLPPEDGDIEDHRNVVAVEIKDVICSLVHLRLPWMFTVPSWTLLVFDFIGTLRRSFTDGLQTYTEGTLQTSKGLPPEDGDIEDHRNVVAVEIKDVICSLVHLRLPWMFTVPSWTLLVFDFIGTLRRSFTDGLQTYTEGTLQTSKGRVGFKVP